MTDFDHITKLAEDASGYGNSGQPWHLWAESMRQFKKDLMPDIWLGREAAHRAEVEKLRDLVRSAFNEGLRSGMNETRKFYGGAAWYAGKSRAALETP
jgi:hypothetical protein